MGGLTPAPKLRPFTSNAAVFQAWHSTFAKSHRPTTIQRYSTEIQTFMRAWDPVLVTTVPRHDIVRYIGEYEKVCCNYRPAPFNSSKERCAAGLDIKQCPLLTGKGTCPKYQGRPFTTTQSHLQTVNNLYDFLQAQGYLENNPAESAIKHWLETNSHAKVRHEARCFTDEELRRLIRAEKRPNVRFLFVLLAKSLVRIEEALSLTIDPRYFNLDEGWILIPQLGGKRSKSKGNHLIIIDDELRDYFVGYLKWRKSRAKPSAGNHLILNAYGRPATIKQYREIKMRWFDRAMLEVGINQPGRPRHENAGPHTFRHWGTQKMKDNRCDREMLELFRGCRLHGNMDVYLHMRIETPVQVGDKKRVEALRAEYLRYGPRIF